MLSNLIFTTVINCLHLVLTCCSHLPTAHCPRPSCIGPGTQRNDNLTLASCLLEESCQAASYVNVNDLGCIASHVRRLPPRRMPRQARQHHTRRHNSNTMPYDDQDTVHMRQHGS